MCETHWAGDLFIRVLQPTDSLLQLALVLILELSNSMIVPQLPQDIVLTGPAVSTHKLVLRGPASGTLGFQRPAD